MPGYVMHLAVAAKIIKDKGITDSDYIQRFLLGNIAPDAMPREDKKGSHFWDDETYANLNRIPNLGMFTSKYGDKMEDPFVKGYYTHLYLDNIFVREYWEEHFGLLSKDMKLENSYDNVKYIKLIKSNIVYDRGEFFSEKLYYGDYDRINPYIFERYPVLVPKYIDEASVLDVPIDEIRREDVKDTLNSMIEKVSILYSRRQGLFTHREKLKVFDMEHMCDLMNKVVGNVCGTI